MRQSTKTRTVMSTSQVLPIIYRKVDQDSTEVANQERTREVDKMVTETDFERWLPSQCQFPMTTVCKRYSTEHCTKA